MVKKDIFLTIDIDWAPDEQIDFFVDIFLEHQIKATIFITHYSKAIQRILDASHLFEIGIHPNFQQNSTQGNNFKEVMNNLLSIAPTAIGIRTHGLHTSSKYFFDVMHDYHNFKYDASTYLPYCNSLRPYLFEYNGKSIYKIPFNWEDDLEFCVKRPLWSIDKLDQKIHGLIIQNFHPVHIYYNNATVIDYQKIKNGKVIDINNQRQNITGSYAMLQSIIKNQDSLFTGVLSEFIDKYK